MHTVYLISLGSAFLLLLLIEVYRFLEVKSFVSMGRSLVHGPFFEPLIGRPAAEMSSLLRWSFLGLAFREVQVQIPPLPFLLW